MWAMPLPSAMVLATVRSVLQTITRQALMFHHNALLVWSANDRGMIQYSCLSITTIVSWLCPHFITIYCLVGGTPTPLKNIKVSWDDYSQYMGKQKKIKTKTNHQPAVIVAHQLLSGLNVVL
jgi:hypothetical protein